MELDAFIDSIINEKGLTNLTPEVRKTVANELKSALVEQINHAVLMELPDEKLDELNELMDKSELNDEQLQEFIRDSGANIDKITAETMIRFKAFYLGNQEA